MLRCTQFRVFNCHPAQVLRLRRLPVSTPLYNVRCFATQQKKTGEKSEDAAAKLAKYSSERSYLDEIFAEKAEQPKTTAQKVKKGAATTMYTGIAIGSVAILGALGYYFVEQFFAGDSPQAIYSKTLKYVHENAECVALYGNGIKGFGEDTGRGRRRHIANHKYVTKDGEQRVRVMYHIKGDRHSGKVYAEVFNRDGQWDYRYIYTVTDETIPKTIILLDNR